MWVCNNASQSSQVKIRCTHYKCKIFVIVNFSNSSIYRIIDGQDIFNDIETQMQVTNKRIVQLKMQGCIREEELTENVGL